MDGCRDGDLREGGRQGGREAGRQGGREEWFCGAREGGRWEGGWEDGSLFGGKGEVAAPKLGGEGKGWRRGRTREQSESER